MFEHDDGSGAPDIAIIGMVGRFPGAPDLESFWRNLRDGKTAIRRLEPAELDELGVDPELRRDPHYVPAAATLDGMEQFDAAFFGCSPREAELLDPQQRVFLECAWEALEDAGYDPESGKGCVGVFAGATASTYLLVNLASRPELATGGAGYQLFIGNTVDSLATRVSYKLNLRGPSFAVQSACSTSLLAVHLACQSLLNEECDLALAGGVSINLAQRAGYYHDEGSLLSPGGTCCPFDASAQGTVFGAGVGIVALKRLSDALADGDCIRAVIRGSAAGNDGKLKVGFTAPGIEGQSAVIAEALALSGLRADEISYVEAHGTGTSLGDPIEIEALSKAFRATTQRKGFCALGTVKGNIGHLDTAAGVAGLIKTVLALQNEEIPPSPGFKEPNPRIDFANSPVYVNRALSPWRSGRTPRRAGVSSFGLGGTNVHAVLEEAPRREARPKSDRPQLLVLSAKTPQALDAATARLGEHLEGHPELELMDVAHTLQTGRHAFRYRRSVVAGDAAEAAAKLKARQAPPTSAPDDGEPGVAFLFPGQGSQAPGMGADLYKSQPVFRQQMDECAAILKPQLGFDLRELLFVEPSRFAEVAPRLDSMQVAQPAVFAMEYSLAKTWMAWGIQPKAMLGHSLGEYVAACVAGVFSLPDALAIIAARGRLMQSTARGAMLAVGLSREELPQAILEGGLSVAAINERNQCVLSGPPERVEAAIPLVAQREVPFKRLDISCAAHSTLMEPIMGELRERIARVRRSAPQVPFVSNVTGTWIRPEQATDPDYWAEHLRQTVRFAEGLAALRSPAEHALLEVGPGQPLGGVARRSGAKVVASSMPGSRDELTESQALLAALGQLWQAGVAPDWAAVHGADKPRRTPLPTYPFERRRYWISARRRDASQVQGSTTDEVASSDQVLHPRPELEQALIAPRNEMERAVAELWQRLLGLEQVGVEDSFFSVGGDSLLATQLASQLRSKFGVEVPLRRLLERPTVAAAAELVSSLRRVEAEEPATGDVALKLREKVQAGGFDEEIPYWLAAVEPLASLPVDGAEGAAAEETTATVSVALEAQETRSLLEAAGRAYRTREQEILVAALVRALCEWTGRPTLSVALEGHGREEVLEDVDLSRTADCFTSLVPVRLSAAASGDVRALIQGTKETLRQIPHGGIGYGLLRHWHKDETVRERLGHAGTEVTFSYLGQFDTARGPRARRGSKLEVNAEVSGERLRVEFVFSETQYRRSTIEGIAERYLRALRDIIAHCVSQDAGGYTPSDFPLARLDQATLDRWFAERRDIEAAYPLSPLQEGMLFYSVLHPGSGVYGVQMSCFFTGADIDSLEAAWKSTVARYPALRTSYQWEGLERPLHRVHANGDVEFKRLDWRGEPDPERRWEEFLAADRQREFELDKAPPLRLAAVALDDDRTAFLWSFHHVLLDGWSTALILRDVFEEYQSRVTRREPRLAPTGSHEEYIRWLLGQDRDAAEAFWRHELRGFSVPTSLGIPREHSTRPGIEKERLELSPAVTEALTQLARRAEVTLNNVVQAAWGLLLSRYNGGQDVAFGMTLAGRPPEVPSIESAAGLFINMVPLRLRVEPAASVLSWIKAVHGRQGTVQPYEWAPLADIEAWSELPRGTPLFETLLVFMNFPIEASLREAAATLSVSEIRRHEQINYPLMLEVTPAQRLLVEAISAPGAYEPGAIRRVLEHLENLLGGMAAHPEQPLSALEMLSESERRKLLVEWNDTAEEYPEGESLPSLFEAQARRTPDSVALRFGAASLTYRELDERSNQLAAYLRGLGVGPDIIVGLCGERSPEMIVAMWAMLKAGGAYLPLDPQLPPERISYMLADARVSLVLARDASAAALLRQTETRARLVRLDEDWPAIAQCAATALAPIAGPGHLAYVIYTSGSTGMPKGVMVERRSLHNYVRWGAKTYRPVGGGMVASSLAFDFVGTGLFPPFLCGSAVHLMPEGDEVQGLAKLVASGYTGLINITPAHLNVLAQQVSDSKAGSALGCISVGGEAVPPAIVETWRRIQPGIRVVNEYGPTEATVACIAYDVPVDAKLGNNLPIGTPITNTRDYVLDGHGEPVPVGAVGELYIGGDCLARGYLGRPELTAEKFVPDPFCGRAGARMYRTGDLARWRPDGLLECLGRIDHQVKVRGFRIELGDIEAALGTEPGVEACAVVVREKNGDKELVAYVASKSGSLVTGELRSSLKRRLPAYMVPSVFVVLEALPLNANGKVDRKALPAPEASRTALGTGTHVGPRSPMEELLAGLFGEVLGIPAVSIHDNFFELGGHSLKATQLVSRMRAASGIELPLRTLFERPTVAELAEALQGGAQRTEGPVLHPVPRGEPLPLSFAQQRLWFLEQMVPGWSIYNIPVAARLRGALDVAVLKAAFNRVVERHEALRTTFATVDGRAVQVVAPSLAVDIPVLEREEGVEAEEWVREAARREASQGFDLGRGPLVRAKLLRLGAEEHVLLATMHHIVSDAWSMGVLIREVAALCEAFQKGEPSPLPELPIQYPDFSVWQREWLSGQRLEEQLAYWKERLSGLATLELPADKVRPPVQTYNGARCEFELPAALMAKLKKLSQQQGATLFMTLLAGFKALMHRYTGQGDISIGTPIANRSRAELEGLIGFFVNTLVMRTEVDGRESFAELLGKVRTTALGAWAHQDLPFERLVEALQPERDMSRTPLFQVMFVLQNAPAQELKLSGLTLEPLGIYSGGAKFDLMLELWEAADGGLRCWFEYNTDLFEAATPAQLAQHYRRLLEAAVEAPSARIAELELLSEAERRKLLVEWNDTAAEYPREACVHQLFEEQAAARPEAVAVLFGGARLTYAELNAKANQLAHALKGAGVGPESRVGLAVERSLEMVVGALGILKAGGAYVPLDSSYPEERLAFMRKEAEVSVVVAPPSAPAAGSAKRLWLDECDGQPTSNPPSQCDAENLAYVMFTSGSTGQPKGVGVSHRAIARLVRGNVYARLTPEETILQAGPLGFDASTFEIWGSLLNGGRLAVAPPGAPTLEVLEKVLQEHGVTTLFITTALFHHIVAQRPELLRPVKQLLTGGEVVSPQRVEEARRALPDCRISMVYGPTEATTFSSHYPTRGLEPGTAMPIGWPLANTGLYVLGGDLRPVPPGAAGELFIGGAGLARGYVGRPELTAERFVPDAFSGVPGSRLYRTGDKARYRPDGCIEFLGRVDDQVKIRGYRIEPAEVEAALQECDGVQDAIVVVRQQASEKQLVAYYVGAIGAAELRAWLKRRMPEYMVPAVFVPLPALPVTPNGKVDRRALPAPEASRAALGAGTYVGPRSPEEEMLAGFFGEVLGLPAVGIHDNFFELGGHSLKATQLVSRVRGAWGVELPLRALFERPTVAGLAEVLQGKAQQVEGPALRPVPRGEGLPLSFAQQRLWFLEQLEPGGSSYNIPVALRLRGALDVEALRATLNEVVRRHESLRTTFAPVEGRAVQVVAPRLAAEIAIVEREQGMDAEPWVLEQAKREAAQPFDLTRGPLLRVKLLRLGAEEHVLLVTMHHIVSDGWSMGVLVREVAALYEAFRRGEPSPLPELAIQYPDFSVWQREWLSGQRLDRQLTYWKERLSGLATLDLPTDKVRPPVQTFHGAQYDFELTASLTAKLKKLSQQQGATLFMTLLAGFKALLHRYTGQSDIAVGTPIANRSRAELEGLIGFFVNSLVMRTEVGGGESFAELLAKVRATALGAWAHQDLPFEQLVEALQPERDMSRSPLFQAMFVLQNAPAQELKLPGLTLEPVEVNGGTAKFDITLMVSEAADGKLRCSFEYNTDLFDAATPERWAEHYRRLLESAAEAPSATVAELELLSEEERRKLLVEWNDTAAEYPREACVHQLFEEQAAARPEAVAVLFGDSRLTYVELNAKANQLAHALKHAGVGPESRVGLAVERSLEMVVGALGILKAGGAYVPLDSSYPEERLAFMRKEAGVSVVVAPPSIPVTGGRRVWLDECDGEPTSNLPSQCGPENLAYVLFTSGSTGQPKGVGVTHRAIARLVRGNVYARLTPKETILQAGPLGFDASTFELWGSLLNGGRLALLPPGAPSLEVLEEAIRKHHVTTLWLTAALFHHVVAQRPGALSGVKQLLTGGDAVSPQSVETARRALPGCELVMGYGPTEATTFSSYYRTRGSESGPAMPIGLPLANTRLYILDGALRPVPVGVVGELYIGGDGLARGYLGQPELTAERFVPDAFSGIPGGRLYRTGDRVKHRPDGCIDFLGRVDEQVKIRGYRIEPAEVESVLRRLAGVKDAVVVVRQERGDKQLVAYYAGTTEAAQLRAELKRRLPEYMVPSALVALPALPVTPNGKVDRRALPAPEASRAALGAGTYVGPRSPVEEMLAGFFGEVLGLPAVGIHDNFFELGGHSLKATQLVLRVRDALGVELPLRTLFERPTVAGLAEALQGGAQQMAEGPALRPLPRGEGLPLSFAQQRLWFLDELEPGGSSYNIPVAVRLRGALDVEALRATLNEVVRRHESLRTSFKKNAGAVLQVVAPSIAVEIPVVDLARGADPEQWARQQVRDEAAQGFDLSRGPLVRAKLLRLSAEEHVLLVTMHHIVSDGWSMGVLVREVAALYGAFHEVEPSPLPELPIQYPDFSVWQREWLSGERLERELTYWKAQLGGLTPLELPADKVRPAVQTYNGARHELELPANLTERLKKLSQQQGATLFMTLLAGFKALLHRYTGQSDISIGTPIANRSRAELEGLIGFFVNTLVLRTEVDGGQPFAELVERVRGTALGAYAHQDLPFEQLVEALQPERDLSRSPLFQVMFTFQNAPVRELELPGLVLEPVEIDGATAKFDLTLDTFETADGTLRCSFEYNTDLFERVTLERWAGHYRRLLEAAVEAPGARVSELEILSEAERLQLLVEWNDTAEEYPMDACLHSLFEAQARRTPSEVAVVSGDSRLTYSQLDAKANQLAHSLKALGVEPEVRVGICVERSLDMVVGLLGILKAGGTYVPLDPAYPAERLGFMLDDARAPVVLSQRSVRQRLPETSGRVVLLDEDAAAISALPTTPVASTVTPDNLAYLIYTSGSTGRPKGVAIAHRSAVALIGWAHGAYSEAELRKVLASTSICFDLSIFELYVPLARGGTVVLARDAMQLLSGGFEGLTLINTVPSAMAELLRSNAVPGSVRAINLAGEPLKPALVQEIFRRTPVRRVCDLYGPSEDTTYSTGAERQPDGPATIGRSIANKRLYLLDKALNPVPIGVPGELYVAGAGLARGYLDRPELTAERFVPNPFSAEPGARMYRTGDLARWRAEGRVEFLGRIDHQVKVRGFRIELGEVEAALAARPGVDACVVIAREDTPGEKRLVAYVGAQGGASAEELRGALKQRLPEYMVPSAFVVMKALPLLPNGKVDRKALPAPEASRAAAGAGAYVGPRSPVEEMLAGFFGEVLGLPAVGIHDNFFELGGHSLKATQLVSRVREAFAVEVPLRAVFERPTVAGLAQALAGNKDEVDGPKLGAVARPAAVPLSFAQQRLWFLEQLDPGGSSYNMPVAVRLEGTLDVEAFQAALNEVVRRHEALRTTFATVDGRAVQVVAPELVLDVPVVECGRGEVESRAREESAKGFDLSRGPLLRARLLRLEAEEHVLLVTMHHVVSDGWSMGVLVREVSALYEAFQKGEASPLPELAIQYPDFAVWQREWLSGQRLEKQLAYWKQQLEGLATLELPADRARPPMQTYNGARHDFELPAELAASLKKLSQQHGATLFMTLLAGFKALLHRYTGQGDIAVGTPIANRSRAELEGLIGFFVNTLVLRTAVDGKRSFAELVDGIRATALAAYAHQDLPFEQLVEALQPERDASRTPLFQVMFVLQNAPVQELESSGLTVEPVAFDTGTAKFDVTLAVSEAADGELRCSFEYNTDLFDAQTPARWAEHYARLLEAAAAEPEARISELSLLSESERRQLLVTWNETSRKFPRNKTVGELFEEQAAARPDAVAVLFGDSRLTYAELNAKANQLAHALRRSGVGPESRVGLAVERSPEMVVGVLGILKAGGAYVPLDSSYPEERLAFMRKEAGVSLVVAPPRAAAARGAKRVWLDDCKGKPRSNPPSQCGPENLAYVLFTSGSTGQPKGVGVTHRAIARLVRGNVYARLTPKETILQAGPLGFDASTFELWGSLLNGGRLALLPPGAPSLEALEEAIQTHHVTTLWLTAALFHSVVAQRPGVLSGVKQLLTGGDAVSPHSVELARRALPGCELIMGYGPTEATTFSSYYRSRGGESGAAMPIGFPLANARLYVLDAGQQPVPVGVAGELYIGGEGLARGYLGQPELTAERFVPDAFSGIPGGRLYRTGDRVKHRPDGCIDFLGRVDEQVKIRGYRIEPAEVESVLRRLAGVKDAVVVVRQERGDKQLVAYYAGTAEAAQLRAELKRRLPEYMVPSALVVLPALPVTPNGKVDRRALPAPVADRSGAAAELVLPRTPAEEAIARVWSEVLGIPRIGIHDNFFELGGHSLLLVALLAKLRERVGLEVSVRAFMEAPTIAGIASTAAKVAGAVPGLPHALPACLLPLSEGTGRPLFLIHPAGGDALCFAALAQHLPGVPVFGLQSPGLSGEQAPLGSLDEIARHYVAAIRTVQPQGPYFVAGWSLGAHVAVEVARYLRAGGEDVPLCALIDGDAAAGVAMRQEFSDEAFDDNALWLRFISNYLEQLGGEKVPIEAESLKGLPLDTQVEVFVERLRGLHLLQARLMTGDQLRRVLAVFKANVRALMNHVPQKYDGPLTIIEAERSSARAELVGAGWAERTSGAVESLVVPGDHITALAPANAPALAGVLLRLLNGRHFQRLSTGMHE